MPTSGSIVEVKDAAHGELADALGVVVDITSIDVQ
jgi:hypothetical protein